MNKDRTVRFLSLLVALGLPFILVHPVLAATGDVAQIESFIRSIIKVISSLAGLIATGFFVLGGLGYIASSGNPERLEKAKQTLIWSGVGLAIVIGAFILSNIVTGLATSAFGK